MSDHNFEQLTNAGVCVFDLNAEYLAQKNWWVPPFASFLLHTQHRRSTVLMRSTYSQVRLASGSEERMVRTP